MKKMICMLFTSHFRKIEGSKNPSNQSSKNHYQLWKKVGFNNESIHVHKSQVASRSKRPYRHVTSIGTALWN